MADGLRSRERCLYSATSAAELDHFRHALRQIGVEALTEEERGALLMVTCEETHLAGGTFDSERMLRMLNDGVESALNAGFVGLRACGDMSWLVEHPAGAEQCLEYEAILNSFFRGLRALGMCQYNRARLPPTTLDGALATHPTVTVGGGVTTNMFYRPSGSGVTLPASSGDVDWKIRKLQRQAVSGAR